MMSKSLTLMILLLVVAGCGSRRPLVAEHDWSATVLYVRHAPTAPGTEDPATIDLADCATQRNLSHEGRVRAGELAVFAFEQGLDVVEVHTSPYCRCIETARTAFGRGEAAGWLAPATDEADRTAKIERLQMMLGATVPGSGTRVLVGHSSLIGALGFEAPEEGDAIVFRARGGGEYDVLGRIVHDGGYRFIPESE